jgi:UDP-2,3-diacylglucosamine hydrolase
VNRLGLIAGNGVFPIEVAAAARRRQVEIVAIAHLDETDPALEALCGRITWVRVGELQKIIETFKAAGVTEAAMAGGISRARLKHSFAPDARAIAMLQRVGRLSDDAVLRGLAAEIESEGIRVIDPVPMIADALARKGLEAGPQPSESQLKDLALALKVARALGPHDVGQTVAVLNSVVAAVEAVEGTDAALVRAAELSGKGLVIAKAVKPGQDLRFDRPAIGPATIELLNRIGAALIGVEAGQALILERERTVAIANQRGVTIYGVD